MKKTVCILFLLLTACAGIAPIPTATPTAMLPTASPTIEPTATPDIIVQALAELQKVGITASKNDGMWTLSINGVEIPDAHLDENGFIVVKTKGGEIKTPLSSVENIDGALVIKDAIGKKLATWNPANPEAGWILLDAKEFPVCDAEHFKECPVSLEDLAVGGDYDKWAESQLAGLNLPEPDTKIMGIGIFSKISGQASE